MHDVYNSWLYNLYSYREIVTVEECLNQESLIPPKVWISDLNLDENDRENVLSPTGWLSDKVINAAQKILSKQFPDIFGLQDVALGHVMNFTIQDGEFLQILHSVNHWVTISSIGLQHPNINLYDSNYLSIPTLLQAQMACLVCTEQEQVAVNVMTVQSQVYS